MKIKVKNARFEQDGESVPVIEEIKILFEEQDKAALYVNIGKKYQECTMMSGDKGIYQLYYGDAIIEISDLKIESPVFVTSQSPRYENWIFVHAVDLISKGDSRYIDCRITD